MAGIFLSYAREDRGCAEKLAQALELAGHEVWWDRRIDSGSEFTGEIEEALDAADVVLVAWSKDSVKSRWVRDEASIGGDSGRLLPVLIDGTQPPLGFRQFHALDLTGWKGGRKDPRSAELLQAIGRKLKGKAKAEPASPAAESKPRFALPEGRRLWAIAATLVLVIVASTVVFLTSGQQKGGPLPKPTIALLPFGAASPDAQLRDLAAQARDSVSHTLSQTGVPVRLLNSVPEDRQSAGDFLLSAELSRNADKIVATIRLDEAVQGVTIASTRIEAAGDDVRNLPERIGAQVAAKLSNGATLIILDRRHPTDPALMAELMATTDDALQNYQIAKRVAAKAPDVPSAQIGLAFYTGFALGDLPREERLRAVVAARRAAQRALALAPDFGDTYATACLLYGNTRMGTCEDQLRTGNRIDPDAPYLNAFLSGHLRIVGRFDEAARITRLSYAHDPYDAFKIGSLLRTLEFAGDTEEARKLHQQGVRWWPEAQEGFFWNRLAGFLDRGDFDGIRLLEQEVGPEHLPARYSQSGPLVTAVKSKSPGAVRHYCVGAEQFFTRIRCMMAFAIVGDQDGAYAIADKLYPRRVGRTPAETERIWLDDPHGVAPLEFITSPAAAAMRRDPRYLQLTKRVGLLDYWRSGRPPDFCRKQPEPICTQLLKRS